MLSKEEIENAKKFMNNIKQTIQENNMLFGEENIMIKAGKTTEQNIEIVLQYIEELEQNEKRLRNKLEKDVVNITKSLQAGNRWDDYRKCRLKAYRTKTKEILKLMEG